MPYKLVTVWNEGGASYFTNVAATLQTVNTPYAMRADDDDFLAMSGIERCLDFLDTNPDHVAASGRIAGFSVSGPQKPLYGRLNRRYLYHHADDLSQATVHDRLIAGANKLWVYYAIHRTPALQTITRDIADINFSDLLLYEAFHTMRTLTLGKAHLDDKSISYFRQYGTSSSAADNRDWPARLLRSTFSSDISKMRQIIPDDAALDALDAKFRQFLYAQFSGTHLIKRAIRTRFPRLVAACQNRYRPLGFTEWWPLKDIPHANEELAKVKLAIRP